MEARSENKIVSSSDAKHDEKENNSQNIPIYPVTDSFISMRGGDGDYSYANNSLLQRIVMKRARPLLVEAIRKMIDNCDCRCPSSMQVVDLGCSSGPNTFLVVSEIIDTVDVICRETNQEVPEFNVFLNDLPENDFNTTFKLIPFFHKNLKPKRELSCFIFGVCGSFYSRLFPSNSLHVVHSSYSLHWLSKVPEGLEDNKESVFITSSSPLSVYKSYLGQFQRDFGLFLRLRSKEMMSRGCMVLTFIGRNASDPLHRDCCHFWTLLSNSLLDLVSEGLLNAADVDAFNMPFYDPSEEEVKKIIENEGSFEINKLKTFEYDLGETKKDNSTTLREVEAKTGRDEADHIRSITEPMLVAHFGDSIIDSLFAKYAKHVIEHTSCTTKTTISIVVSMSKKY